MKYFIICVSVCLGQLCLADSAQSGRFQLIQLGEMRRDQFLLDSQTGKVWRSKCAYVSPKSTAGECDVSAFFEVPVLKSPKDFDELKSQIKATQEYDQKN